MTGKEAKEKLKKQYDRSNDFIRNNYDRISVTVPKGIKEKIKEYLPEKQTVNGLINALINGWINDQEQPEATQSHTEPPQLDTLPEELPPLDWSQLPEDLNDMTLEQAEIIRRRCEARKAQEAPPEPIPPEDLPFH